MDGVKCIYCGNIDYNNTYKIRVPEWNVQCAHIRLFVERANCYLGILKSDLSCSNTYQTDTACGSGLLQSGQLFSNRAMLTFKAGTKMNIQ